MRTKQELRRYYLKLRASLSESSRFEQSQALQKKIFQFLPRRGSVASYCAIGNEVDLMPLNRSLAKDKRLVLPYTHKDFSLTLYEISNLDQNLSVDEKGISAPDPDLCDSVIPGKVKAVIVPGIVFDIKKYRLGYGKGCYDQLLKKLHNVLTIGVTYEECLIRELPRCDHDIPVQLLLTATGEIQ